MKSDNKSKNSIKKKKKLLPKNYNSMLTDLTIQSNNSIQSKQISIFEGKKGWVILQLIR